jgi:hypothetical protein
LDQPLDLDLFHTRFVLESWLLQDEHSEYLDLPKTVSGALIGAQGTLKLGNPGWGIFPCETSTVRMYLGHCEGWKFEV